jgi:hypothetical protein
VLSRPFWLSISSPDELRPRVKVARIIKFASKIFYYQAGVFCAASHNQFTVLCG